MSLCWTGNPASLLAHFPILDSGAGGWLPPDAHTQLPSFPSHARTAFGPGPQTCGRLEGGSPLLPAHLVVPLAARPVCYLGSSYRLGSRYTRYTIQSSKEARGGWEESLRREVRGPVSLLPTNQTLHSDSFWILQVPAFAASVPSTTNALALL